jgi:hypothetical protein
MSAPLNRPIQNFNIVITQELQNVSFHMSSRLAILKNFPIFGIFFQIIIYIFWKKIISIIISIYPKNVHFLPLHTRWASRYWLLLDGLLIIYETVHSSTLLHHTFYKITFLIISKKIWIPSE